MRSQNNELSFAARMAKKQMIPQSVAMHKSYRALSYFMVAVSLFSILVSIIVKDASTFFIGVIIMQAAVQFFLISGFGELKSKGYLITQADTPN